MGSSSSNNDNNNHKNDNKDINTAVADAAPAAAEIDEVTGLVVGSRTTGAEAQGVRPTKDGITVVGGLRSEGCEVADEGGNRDGGGIPSQGKRGGRRRRRLPPMVAVLKVWEPDEMLAAMLAEGSELRLHRYSRTTLFSSSAAVFPREK